MPTEQQKQDTSIPSLREKFRARFTQSTQTSDQTYTDKTVSLGMINELNSNELLTLTNRHYVKDPRPVQDESDLPIFEAATITARETISNIADAERLKALDPNIKRVEAIVVSSIMSPNDLQDVNPDIVIETDEIDDSKKSKISELLSNFYNGPFELRKRLTRWIKEAHFRSGAGVTILLPEATLTKLIQTYDPDRHTLLQSSSGGTENMSPKALRDLSMLVTSEEFYKKVCSYNPYTHQKSQERKHAGKEGIQINKTDNFDNESQDDTSWLNMDKFIKTYLADDEIPLEIKVNENRFKNYKIGLESIALNFAKSLSGKKDQTEQDYVKIINNPEMLRFGKIIKEKKEKNYHKLYKDSVLGRLLEINNPPEDGNLYYQDIPLMDITGFMTDYEVQKSFPIVMDVPTEAFIPIITPGDKSRILGGFLLTDEYGQFVEASGYVISGTNPASNRLSVAYNAMYGEMPTESGIRTASGLSSSLGAYTNSLGIYPNMCGCNKESIIKVFNYVLDEMLKKRLEDMGLSDVTLGRYNAIAQCMLHRLLDKKKTRLVFVPEKYITYMTFDQHFDGTGKSRIEDILYMESLKISFLTASTLASMKNAVPIKKVKLNLDTKQRNTIQTAMMVRNAIVQREKLTPSTWPATVSSQIQSQNLSIETTHPNSEGFSFTVEDSHREIPKADTEFLQEIDNASIIGLGCIPSALSESSEVQFARSLATTNLYFAKSIRQDQITVEDHGSSLVHKHLSLSSVLILKIAEILNDKPALTATDPKNDNPSDIANYKPDAYDGSTTVSQASKSLTKEDFEKVLKIIESVRVKLSPPNAVPDEAQYALLTETIKRIAEYVDAVYPDDLSSFGGDTDVSNAYKLMKSQIKAEMVRDVASTLGFRGLLSDVPEMSDFVMKNRDELSRTFEILNGIQESIKRTQQAMTKKQDQNADTSESDSGSAGSLW